MGIQPELSTESFTYLPCPNGVSKAVTVLVHGLNNKPGVMMPLAEYLLSLGSDVILVGLTGHNRESPLSSISTEAWLNDLQQAHNQALKIRKGSQVKPLYFLGYSLGAVINLYLMSQSSHTFWYDKMVLLAPASFLRRRVMCLKPLAVYVLPDMSKIPSLTPCAYQANASLTVRVYKILFRMAEAVEKKAYREVSMPVLVIIDPRDEMVSLRKLAKSMDVHRLHHWKICLLQKPRDKGARYAHLILDEQSAGKENWQDMLQQIRLFLVL